MASKLDGIGLTSLDDLFKTDAERQTEQGERVLTDTQVTLAVYVAPEENLQNAPEAENDQ